MNLIPNTDRRHAHWHDTAEAARLAFHPEAIADDPCGALAKLGELRLARGECPSLDEFVAMLAEAPRPLSPLPEF
jgi:hypothetical protein